ncbi:MAG: HIT family protein, partial [Gemmatimonadota bacterium]
EMVSLIHEDDRALAFMDVQPVSAGHTLVVSRDHHPTLFEVPDGVASHCIELARRIGTAVARTTDADAVNLFCANGRAGGQDVPHFHLHLIPVRSGQDFALQLPMEDAPIPSRSELDIMAARIGRAIQEANNR